MQNNKIIYQITPYYPPHLGGLENCVKKIAQKLTKLQYDVRVITSAMGLSDKNRPDATIPVTYLRSIEIAHTPISFHLPFELNKIPSNSLLHIHISNAFFPEVASFMARLKKLKYIIHFHIDVESSGIFGFVLPFYKKFILAKVLKNAQKIICLTESQKKLLIKKYHIEDKSIVIIPNGVEEKYYLERIKKQTNSITRLLFVGRLSPQKNLVMLIKSLLLTNSRCELHIVGSGDQNESLQNLARELQLKNVYFHGQKKEDELIQYYFDSDIFILPSKNEGMSLALLEAAAAGLPIITTDLPQTRSFITDGAVFVNDYTPTGFANAIDSLIQNSSIRSMMSKHNKNLALKYSWDKVAKKIDMIYKAL